MKRFLLERGGLLALCVAVLYIFVAPTTIIDGDNAEFATLGAEGGAAHPSGYPLYILWLRAMAWLPGASPAHTAAIATALLGAAAILVLHAAARAWGAKPLAASLACAIVASGPVVMRVHSEAEVFALNNLVVALVLWLAAREGPLRGIPRGAALGLVAGLGLANHMTCVLVAPVGILGAIRATRESRPAAAFAVGGLVVGLLPYLYLLVAPETEMSWGYTRDLAGIVHMVLREDYGGPTAFRPGGPDVSAGANLAALASTLGRAWLYVPLAAAVVAFAHKRRDWEFRMLGLAIAVACLLVLRFNVPPEHLGLYVCQRFHLLPALLLAIPVAVGLTPLVERVTHRFALPAVATVGVVAFAAPSLPYVGRVHVPAVELSAKNMLRSLPPNAVVIHGQDELHAASGYVQWALGERQDVNVMMWPLTAFAWYRDRHARRGVAPNHLIPISEGILASGRPLFVDALQRDILKVFPSHPWGILFRVYPRSTALPSVGEVYALNEALYAKFALAYPRPGPDDEYATEVHLRYRAIWELIATMLAKHGMAAEAAHARELAARLGPHP